MMNYFHKLAPKYTYWFQIVEWEKLYKCLLIHNYNEKLYILLSLFTTIIAHFTTMECWKIIHLDFSISTIY